MTPPRDAEQQAQQHAARLARIRREIEAGTYETSEKLAAALDAFLASDDVRAGGDGDMLRRVVRPQ